MMFANNPTNIMAADGEDFTRRKKLYGLSCRKWNGINSRK